MRDEAANILLGASIAFIISGGVTLAWIGLSHIAENIISARVATISIAGGILLAGIMLAIGPRDVHPAP